MRIACLCVALAACNAADERDAQDGVGHDLEPDAQVVSCPNLDCLAGSTRGFRETRHLAAEEVLFPDEPIPESAYVPIDARTSRDVAFSTDLARVDIVTISNGERFVGLNPVREPQRITYALEAFAGGRFMVWIDEDQTLEAELTLFGSGRPVIDSARGVLETVAGE